MTPFLPRTARDGEVEGRHRSVYLYMYTTTAVNVYYKLHSN